MISTPRCLTSSSNRSFPLLFFLLVAITTLPHLQINGLSIAITGSSQGIGLDAAKRLISDGHTVFHCCRNHDRASTAVIESGGGIPVTCDLSNFNSIRTCAKYLIKEAPTLNVLCLNAGIAPSTKREVPNLTTDGYEECIGVNHLGHFMLAHLLKDHLVQGGGVRRIVTTASSVHDPEAPGGAVGGKGGATLGDLSGLGVKLSNSNNDSLNPTMVDGSIPYNGGKVYKDSKLCNVLFCREAVKRWSKDGIQIRSFNPGFIPSSGLFRAPRKDNWLGATVFTFIAGIVGFAVPVEVGGARLAYMAVADEEEVPSGSYFSADVGSKAASKGEGFDESCVSKEAEDGTLSARFWDRSLEIIGV